MFTSGICIEVQRFRLLLVVEEQQRGSAVQVQIWIHQPAAHRVQPERTHFGLLHRREVGSKGVLHQRPKSDASLYGMPLGVFQQRIVNGDGRPHGFKDSSDAVCITI
jgi:hypothetical protein